MKKLFSMMLLCSVIWSACCVTATAAATDTEELFSQKESYQASFELSEGYSSFSEVYYPGVASLTVLLYTDLLPELTLKKGVHYGEGMCSEGLAYALVFSDASSEDYFEWLYCEEFEKVIEPYQSFDRFSTMLSAVYPNLRVCVREFDISKEELYAAREKMSKQPHSIREQLPISDEQAEKWLVCVEDEETWALQDFMIEALYLEDEVLSNRLLLTPWYLWTDVGEVSAPQLYHSEDLRENDVENWKGVQVYTTKEEYARFLGYCKRYEALVDGGAGLNAYHQILKQLEAQIAASPKAGDETATYALVFTLCALPLVGLCVYGWKKRRTAI